MTTSSDLLRRALGFTGAVTITTERYGGETRFVASIRKPGLDSWIVAYDPDPLVALGRAVERLEDKRDLI